MAYIVTRTNSLKDGRVEMTMLDTEQGTAVDLKGLAEKNFGEARKPTWAEVELAQGILEKRLRAHIGADDNEHAKAMKAKQNELEVEKGARLRAELEIQKIQKTLVEAHAATLAAEAVVKFLGLKNSDIIERALSDYIQQMFDLDEFEAFAEAKQAYLVMTGRDWATQERMTQNDLDREKIKVLLAEIDKEKVFDTEEMTGFFIEALRKRGFVINL